MKKLIYIFLAVILALAVMGAETETETETEKATEKETEKSEAVATGDETPIALYLTMFLAALAILVEGQRRRRRD